MGNACMSWKITAPNTPNTPLHSNNRHGELTGGGFSGSREAEGNCPDSLHWPSIHWLQLPASRPYTSTRSAKQTERPLFLLFVYAVGVRKICHTSVFSDLIPVLSVSQTWTRNCSVFLPFTMSIKVFKKSGREFFCYRNQTLKALI